MDETLLDDIIGFLAYHGAITYGMLRQNFGDRIDEYRAAKDSGVLVNVAQQTNAADGPTAHA
jgi:hypothetical protein